MTPAQKKIIDKCPGHWRNYSWSQGSCWLTIGMHEIRVWDDGVITMNGVDFLTFEEFVYFYKKNVKLKNFK